MGNTLAPFIFALVMVAIVLELVRRKVVKAVTKIYVSLAHTDKDVEETIDIFDQALAAIAAGA